MRINDLFEYKITGRLAEWPVDNKATILVSMPPKLFLDLSSSPDQMTDIKARTKTKEFYQSLMNKEEILVHPFLIIDEKTGKVISHEGRARAMAAMDAGDSQYQVAIIVYPQSRQLTMENVPSSWIGQFDPTVKIDFKSSVKILDDHVQRDYYMPPNTK